MCKQEVLNINAELKNASPQEVIKYFAEKYRGKIALSSSLSIEDQVLTSMIRELTPEMPIFTLDTGRLFGETYDLIDKTNKKYNFNIKVYSPDTDEVEQMVNTSGINLFYDSVESRKRCCQVRKITPLKRAFSGLKVWVCGLRQEQSITRYGLEKVEWDEANNLIKLSPLALWSEKEVWDYIKKFDIPYNALHDKGFPSIGCAPCTRAITDGEDVRAGRWWWETPENKECGLHKKK